MLTMLRIIKSHLFISCIHTKRGDQLHQCNTDKGSGHSNCNGYQNTDQLHCKQMNISEYQAVPFRRAVDIRSGKKACCNTAPDSADTMAATRIKRIVITKFLLDH